MDRGAGRAAARRAPGDRSGPAPGGPRGPAAAGGRHDGDLPGPAAAHRAHAEPDQRGYDVPPEMECPAMTAGPLSWPISAARSPAMSVRVIDAQPMLDSPCPRRSALATR